MRVMCCVLRVTGYDKRYAICNLPCLLVYVFRISYFVPRVGSQYTHSSNNRVRSQPQCFSARDLSPSAVALSHEKVAV